jgi:hypothetical protein
MSSEKKKEPLKKISTKEAKQKKGGMLQVFCTKKGGCKTAKN